MKYSYTLFSSLLLIYSCQGLQAGKDFYDAGTKIVKEMPQSGDNTARYKMALNDFDKAIAADPKYADAYAGRAGVKSILNDYAGCCKDAERYAQLDPKKAVKAYRFIGQVKYAQENYIEAVRWYTKAAFVNASTPEIYYDRAIAEIALNDYADALRDCNTTINICAQGNESLKYFYSTRARVKSKLNNKEGACADYRKSLELGNLTVQSDIDAECK